MRFALIGNPNCGKTTLFNLLTGSTAHVGNWAGVTVEKKEGIYKNKNLQETIDIIDLPGIYSLTPYTPEEVVSRNYLLNDKPDLVINIVDASNLERNLYLTTQLLEIDVPMVIALNMMDVVRGRNDEINIKQLEKVLGVKVFEISALRSEGIKELMNGAYLEAKKTRQPFSVLEYSSIKGLYEYSLECLKDYNIENKAFKAVKIIEDDEIEIANHKEASDKISRYKKSLPLDEFEGDFNGKVADARYTFISNNIEQILVKKYDNRAVSTSDKIDRILTNRFLGIPIFLVIMFLVFHLTFSENLFFLGTFIKEGTFSNPIFGTDAINAPGVILFNLMEMFTTLISDGLSNLLENAPEWVNSLFVDGIWAGISAVLSFIPQILCIFLFLSILEDSGYMSRVAFIMDRAFRKFGLSGKAFMPLLMCFGCAVPGIMATKTLENEKERRMTIMLAPFFSCGAKLPIWGVFAAILFSGAHSDLIVFGMYLLGIIVSIVLSIILKLTVFKGEDAPFIMELPAYHLPRLKNVLIHLWDKLKHYVHRAATVIAASIIVIWFLSTFNFRFEMVEISDSILATISKGISWIFIPLGFGMGDKGWMFVVAAFTGLIAKEMVPATLGTFVGMGEDEVLEGENILGTPLALLIGTLSIPAAFAFMAFNLLTIPCMAAVSAAKSELGSRKAFIQTLFFWFVNSYIISMMIYLGLTYIALGIFFIVIIIALIAFLIYRNRRGVKVA